MHKEDRNEQARKRLMTRMIAETLLVPVYRKILKNLVRYQDGPKSIMLASKKWVQMDPRSWNADLRARPSVGLGFANKDENLMAATTVANVQREHFAGGTGLVGPQQLFASAARLVEAVGWKFPGKYFLDPESPEGQQAMAKMGEEKPDPKMAEVQARTQLEQMKSQHAAQMREVELQARMREAEQKAGIDQQIASMKAETERQMAHLRIQSEAQIAAMRMAMEERLAIREQNMENELASRAMKMKTNGAGRPQVGNGVQFGGDIG